MASTRSFWVVLVRAGTAQRDHVLPLSVEISTLGAVVPSCFSSSLCVYFFAAASYEDCAYTPNWAESFSFLDEPFHPLYRPPTVGVRNTPRTSTLGPSP